MTSSEIGEITLCIRRPVDINELQVNNIKMHNHIVNAAHARSSYYCQSPVWNYFILFTSASCE